MGSYNFNLTQRLRIELQGARTYYDFKDSSVCHVIQGCENRRITGSGRAALMVDVMDEGKTHVYLGIGARGEGTLERRPARDGNVLGRYQLYANVEPELRMTYEINEKDYRLSVSAGITPESVGAWVKLKF